MKQSNRIELLLLILLCVEALQGIERLVDRFFLVHSFSHQFPHHQDDPDFLVQKTDQLRMILTDHFRDF